MADEMAHRQTVLSGLELLATWTNDSAIVTGGNVSDARARIVGRRCAVLTNHTGRTRDGLTSLAIITNCGAQVCALFSPEHGPYGNREGDIASSVEAGLKCHSLYGETRRPTAEMMDGLDTVIFDVQDAGVRFYTYSTTLCYMAEACAEHGVSLVVLDRPNPLGGTVCEGPIIDEALRTFVGYARLPIRHSLTFGELARWHRADAGLDLDLCVVPLAHWSRRMLWPETGLTWVPPSPNLPDFESARRYPGTCLLEFCDLSVGRGTEAPFGLIGAPWLEPDLILEDSRHWPAEARAGIEISECDFVPERATYSGALCHGLRVTEAIKGSKHSVVALGMALLASLHRTHPDRIDEEQMRKALPLLGSRKALESLLRGDVASALDIAVTDSSRFDEARRPFLLYD